MNVHDLTRDELDELKSTYYCQLLDSGELEEVCGDIYFPEDIPDDIIFNHYDGINFVKDDFFCNCELAG